jgi:uncharacterized protein (TIGR02145 family)
VDRSISIANNSGFSVRCLLNGKVEISTVLVSQIAATTALSGGIITSDGGEKIVSRGVCWSLYPNPTIANNKTINSFGTGIFESLFTGLNPLTTYFVRAYATNNDGTSYGEEFSFTTTQKTAPVLTTRNPAITQSSARTGGNISSNGGDPVSAYGVCWSTLPNPTISDYITTDGSGTANFSSLLTGLSSNTTYYTRAYATNSVGTAYGDEITFILWINQPGPSVTDIDGNIYNSVKIGNQVWLAENLKTTKFKDGTSIPLVTDQTQWNNLLSPGYCWYYNDETAYKELYGALYNWYAVFNQNICPTGWHVPSDGEWTELSNYLEGENVAGGKLKESGIIHWDRNNISGTNESGFTALPGGGRFTNFVGILSAGYWWTSTPISISLPHSTNAMSRYIYGESADLYKPNTKYWTDYDYTMRRGHSIRCVQNPNQ